MEKKRGRGWCALAGMILLPPLLLIGAYVAAYYATVMPTATQWGMLPFYRVNDEWEAFAEQSFRPMHRVDKRLRPEVWRDRR